LKLLNIGERWRTEKDSLFGPLKAETGFDSPRERQPMKSITYRTV
jgi:hypothetical protein